jgi:hypothetical protein
VGSEHQKIKARLTTAHPIPEKPGLLINSTVGHRGTREVILALLGEISPLGLSKFGSNLGSIDRDSGLSNAERIDNLKVDRRSKNPLAFGQRSVNLI